MIKHSTNSSSSDRLQKQAKRLRCERVEGTLLVVVPPVKWYEFSVPYTSELERALAPATHFEENAILVAPDKFTALMLKIESFPKHIPIVIGVAEAHQLAEIQRRPDGNGQVHEKKRS